MYATTSRLPTSFKAETRGHFWRDIVLGGAAVAGLLFGYPMLMEQTPNPCAAWASLTAIETANNPVTAAFEGQAGGLVAAIIMRRHFPAVPPALSCTGAYWFTLLNPSILTQLTPQE